MQSVTVRQHVKLLPKTCCTCPPCVKQENTYSVYAGMSADAQNEILRIDEVSDDWNRCCCAPYHPLRMEVRQYIPMPGDSNVSDFSHLRGDIARDFGSVSGFQRQKMLRDIYYHQPVLMSMVRDDGQRCCYKCPCKLLSTFVCFNFCRDGMHVYAGSVPNGKELGRPFNLDPNKLIGSVNQPTFGGWLKPTLHLRADGQADTAEPYAKVEGPCFFGGWSEMCCSFQFFVSTFGGPSKSGDVALITKKKPTSLAGAAVELFSNNADAYSIQFNQNAKLTASQKVTVLTAQILADYMWFEGNTEKCKDTDSAIYCYCCYFSCIGALCPVYIAIPKNFG